MIIVGCITGNGSGWKEEHEQAALRSELERDRTIRKY